MGFPDALPCICTNSSCGYSFTIRNLIGGSGSNIQSDHGITYCPKCGHVALIADWSTDSEGKYTIYPFFKHIRKITSVKKLEGIKTVLESANEEITADELAEGLSNVDPELSQFRELLRSIPAGSISAFISITLQIIVIIVMYLSYSVTEQQLDLDREKFEYEKRNDVSSNQERDSARKEIEEINKRIDILEYEFEKQLREQNNISPNGVRPHKPKVELTSLNRIKGSERNKPCPCGSGKKTKKCHPDGFDIA